MREPPRHRGMPPIPQDGDGAVFREPWEAQAFAMVLDLYDKGCFTWSEWVEHLSREIAAAGDTSDQDANEVYYRHWLSALEKIVATKELLTPDELADRKRAWTEADRERDFGKPIELKK